MIKLDGRKINIELARNEMSVSQLSAETGINRASITAIRKGGQCKTQTAGKIARALGVDITEILADELPEAELPINS